MKNQVRGIALLLFGILLAILTITAKSYLGYMADDIFGYASVISGILGIVFVFGDKN